MLKEHMFLLSLYMKMSNCSCDFFFCLVFEVMRKTLWHVKGDKKGGYLMIIWDNFCQFYTKHVVTPHLNHLIEMVQMRGHNIWLQRKNIPQLSSNTPSCLEFCGKDMLEQRKYQGPVVQNYRCR